MTDLNKRVIENYQNDEKMMILIFAQWCINHDLDPVELYQRAYPEQQENELLTDMLLLTVPKEESETIDDHIVIQALQVFDNLDLAFVVQEEIEKRIYGR